MEKILTQFANSGASEKAGLFDSLGIDWALLAFQTVAFLILLFVLHKFVYPPMMEMLVKREKDLKQLTRRQNLPRKMPIELKK